MRVLLLERQGHRTASGVSRLSWQPARGEKHLGVSYPTARLRFSQLLDQLGLGGDSEPMPLTREQILSEVATGALNPAEAQRLLASL